MKDEKLWEERAFPCLCEMYERAQFILDDRKYTFDEICKNAPNQLDGSGKALIYFAYYLPMALYDSILKKYTKGLRHYWRFPYRSEIYKQGDEFEELKQAYEAEPENKELKEEYEWTIECARRDRLWNEYYAQASKIAEQKEKGEISTKEARKRADKLAKKYDCQWRSNDAEKIQFTVMDFSPNSSKENFDLLKKFYESGCDENAECLKESKNPAAIVTEGLLVREFIKGMELKENEKVCEA